MDPLRSYLGRLLLEDVTPVVMVLTTPLAESACRRNGLSFVDMLSPFSLFKKIDVPVRTANDQPYRLQMFKIRMVYASDVRTQDHEVADERVKLVVSEANENALPDLLSDPPQLEDVLKKPEAELCPSWIKRFNRELVRTLSFSEHETFDHPVACLLVVSSKDKEPISKFADLFNTNQLPSLLNEGIMDPQILKHYLVLHDQQDGPQEIAVNILAEMRSTLGLNDCKLLCINSSTQADGSDADNSWLPYNHEGACFLNTDDMNQIKDFMQDFASNHIIPYMEQRIRVLNQQVATTRKGFRNQIKNLWWRKRDDVPEAANGPMYTFTSIESQIRVLSDYAFMLRDYELALSNYRLLSTDYKLDKAWKRFAGVQEMSGLCYFMLDQSRKDAEYCMENAFTTYLRIGSSGQRNATRCGLWWAEMLKTRGQHREASAVYFRISNEEPSLHSAVLLEQAACCYLLSSPRMLRKYGFHLILAGNSYYLSDQKQHAVRVYRNAMFVYKQNPWSYINNHVHFNVGRWYGVLGIFDVAIKHLMEVIACSHQSLTTQSMFLNDFFHFVQSTGEKFDVYKLQLPVFNMSSLRVVYEDHRTYASNSDVDVNESIWHELEEEMIPSSSVVRTNWLDTQPKSSPFRNNKACVCVVGEAVKLNVELKNPLQISVNVSGISLICQLSTDSSSAEGAGAGAPGVVEAAVGVSWAALRGSWPTVLKILQLLKEQGFVLALLLGLSAFFSMAETSITTLWPWKVRELAEKEPENGVFRMLRNDVTRFLTTILIGTTVVNIGATAIVTEAATAMFGEAGVSAATGVMTVAVLLLTEITPKNVAVHNATEVARFVVRPVAWLSLILYPVGRIVTIISMGILKILGLKGRSEPYVTEDELKLMLRGAELSGAIAEDEQDMIENVLEIKDTHVREVMTPLVDVVAIDAAATLIDFKNLWETHQYSRVPVFEERIDNIVGIVYAMDMLEYVEEVEKLKEITVKEIAHMPTYFVPDSMSVWNLLREFKIRQVHMAVVLNEYGGTIGIVTLEDVVEEIVGEIFDENDSKEEIQKKTGNIVMLEDGTFDVDANTSIDDLSEELSVKIPEGHQYETVSGFVCESFGYIPEEGGKMLVILERDKREENDEYQEEGSDHQDDRETTQAYELEVLEANARKVSKVRFKPISSECVDSDNKGVNRLMSKKIIKRKKKNPGDSSDSDDDEECPDITENGCPAELVSYSDEKSAELEDAGSSTATR